MNHLLFGFALCASLAIYPGGLTTLVAALAGGSAALLPRRRSRPALTGMLPSPLASFLGLALATMVVAPMPWPDNPVAPVGISWAAGTNLGGIAVSLSGLWGLQLLASGQPQRGRSLALTGSCSLGMVLLALALHSDSWSGLLGAGGLGAELGRVLLAALWLCCLPLVLGGPPGGLSIRAFGWAAGAGMCLLLGLPQLQSAPFPLVLVAWWSLLAALGLAWVVGSVFGPGQLRRLGISLPAATLNAP